MPNPITSGVQPIQAAPRSGFDKSFKNLLTAKVGTLVPVLCDPVVPGTRVNLKAALKLAMPPLASDTFMNVKLKQEAFFVPASSLYGGFNDFITKRKIQFQGQLKEAILPYISFDRLQSKNMVNGPYPPFNTLFCEFAPGTLADYLGMMQLSQVPSDINLMPKINPLPFLAYHRIYDRFYRNGLIQRPIFQKASQPAYKRTYYADPLDADNNNDYDEKTEYLYTVGQLPYVTFTEGQEADAAIYGVAPVDSDGEESLPFGGIVNYFYKQESSDVAGNYASGYDADPLSGLFHLRQRNFGADYFTTATPTPQKGDPSTIEFTVDGNGDGEISIAGIRAANAMQLFRERNNYVDDNIHAYNRAHYNVSRTGYGESLPQFLGQMVSDVYTDSVNQTAPDTADSSRNPFKSVGAQYGQAGAQNSGSLIEGFEAPEFGYVMVLASLVPEVAYSSGTERHMMELVNGNGVADIPDALLQQVGPQEVYEYEIDSNILGAVSISSPDAWKAGFGYQQRFAHYMEKRDQIHGLFRTGQSLSSFALQRNLSNPYLGTRFLMIPRTYMDGVSAVSSALSNYGYWLDEYFDYKVSMPLAAYSIPSLENPNGPIEWLPKPGFTIK